jgi:putative integral membrane protein (TIGR02587 family)
LNPANLDYARSLGRAFGGALLFAFPLFMTMEMWWLGGFSIERGRLLLFVVASLPMLLGLSYFAGFEKTAHWIDEALDALAAYGVGFVLSAVVLALLGAVMAGRSPSADLGCVALCAVPAAIGALLATKQFSGAAGAPDAERRACGYLGALFLMSVGAVFLAFNVAPTEEVTLISYMMGPWRTLALALASIALLHVVVFEIGFPGQDRRRDSASFSRAFFFYTLPGYAVALLISAYCLWTFGRLDGVDVHEQLTMVAVLSFPAALGAATARLVI